MAVPGATDRRTNWLASIGFAKNRCDRHSGALIINIDCDQHADCRYQFRCVCLLAFVQTIIYIWAPFPLVVNGHREKSSVAGESPEAMAPKLELISSERLIESI